MQYGISFTGLKKDAIQAVKSQIAEQTEKYLKIGNEFQTPVYGPGGVITGHSVKKLLSSSVAPLASAILNNISEQISHCKDDAEVSISAHVTVNRPDPI